MAVVQRLSVWRAIPFRWVSWAVVGFITLLGVFQAIREEFVPSEHQDKLRIFNDIPGAWWLWVIAALVILLGVTLEASYREVRALQEERDRRLRPRIFVRPTRRGDYGCFTVRNGSDTELQRVEVEIVSLEVYEPRRDEFFPDPEFLSAMLHWSLDGRGDDTDVGSTETRIPADGSRVIDVFAAERQSFLIVAANSDVRAAGPRRALMGQKYRFALRLTAQGISQLPIEGYELLCIGGGAGADSWRVEIKPDEERELVNPRYQGLDCLPRSQDRYA